MYATEHAKFVNMHIVYMYTVRLCLSVHKTAAAGTAYKKYCSRVARMRERRNGRRTQISRGLTVQLLYDSCEQQISSRKTQVMCGSKEIESNK